ncbi:MAG: hypothetical protein HYZ19_00435 [Rhodocyclales bacterium]|nr:hypothetical protein [Rhodocyclales bacterium]
MDWEFTPEQIVKAEVGYGLEDFRRDLAREVRMNMGGAAEEDIRQTYALIYDLCHWLATNRPFEEFAASLAYDPPTVEFLESLREPMGSNVDMLGAILQRLIMDRVEAGLPLEQALKAVAEYHERVVAEPDASSQ